jgi:hypothetical protein
VLYSSIVIEEQQKTQVLKAEEIAAMLGLKVQTVYRWPAVVSWTK